jgi:hypothetical protein
VGILEGPLKGVQIFYGSQPFDGQDFVAIGLYGKYQAGANRLSIKYNRARAAHAMFTANVRAGQT